MLLLSCGDSPEVAQRPAPSAPPAKAARPRRLWCDAKDATPDATLELTVVLPTGRSIDSLSLPLVRCPADAGAHGPAPSRCESSESFEPAAWFNGCARLAGANSTEARLQLSLSWSGTESGQCDELATVPLHGSFFKMLPCGVKLAGQLRKPVPATG
jgi:hypothetical protein